MTNKTKMMIITSSRSATTRIIDLDQVKTNPSNQNEEDIFISLALRAKFPPSVGFSFHRNISDLIRFILCGDRAIGYNYDVLSCGSCKASFRRNAHHDRTKVRCLMGRDQCSVAYTMERKCQKCRLKRCLEMGMRKEFLLSEEAKQKRRKRAEESRKMSQEPCQPITTTDVSLNPPSISPIIDEIDQLMEDLDEVDENFILNGIDDLLSETLSIEDWTTIEKLKGSFISFFEIPEIGPPPFTELSDDYTAFMNWSNMTNKLALLFINFFRQIHEFEQLHLDDRVILIKYNLFPSFPICKCYHDEERNGPFSLTPNLEGQKHRQFFLSRGASTDTLESVILVLHSLTQISERDAGLLSLLLVIIFFTPGLSMSEEEPPMKDSIGVNRVQSHYTKILWNYLLSRYGEFQTQRRFIEIITVILRLQSAANKFRSFFRKKCATLNAIDQITPLVQTVLNLS